jgi:hypothetical protein
MKKLFIIIIIINFILFILINPYKAEPVGYKSHIKLICNN